MPRNSESNETATFSKNERQSRAWFTEETRQRFADLSTLIQTKLMTGLANDGVKVHDVRGRVKTVQSFVDKAMKPMDFDPLTPKYADPTNEITDLAGIRVITFLNDDLARVQRVIESCFQMVEEPVIKGNPVTDLKLGYRSTHCLVALDPAQNPPKDLLGLTAEIQVRTLLQHVWAEVGHELEYKNVERTSGVSRRLAALAGMLEIGDTEVQRIVSDSVGYLKRAEAAVESGAGLDLIETTAGSLHLLLSARLGRDMRSNPGGAGPAKTAYQSAAALAHNVFQLKTLRDVDQVLGHWPDRGAAVSKAIHGTTSQSPLLRFQEILLAEFREEFIAKHPAGFQDEAWRGHMRGNLKSIEWAGLLPAVVP